MIVITYRMRNTPEDLVSLEASINNDNSRYLGINLDQLIDKAGEAISNELLKKYGKQADYAFLCGLGNNGGDGMATARHLAQSKLSGRVTVYLVGRQKDIITQAAQAQWQLLQELVASGKSSNLTLKQDVFAPDIDSHHILVECLSGSGRKGELKKRFRDVIKRATHFRQHLVAIDNPIPGYTWELSLSLFYPKTTDAKVIELSLPSEVSTYTGPGEVKALFQPRRDSYKSQNGKLLIIGGKSDSESTLLSAQAASIYVDAVYLYPITETKMYICVSDPELEDAINQTDAILIGSDWEETLPNKALLNHLLATYPEHRYVLVGTAVTMADIELVKKSGNVVFIPQRNDLPRLLDVNTKTNPEALEGRLRRFSAENNCYLNLLGSISLLFGHNLLTGKTDMRVNKIGQHFMGKPEANAILAGITAAFATKNNLWLSLTAGAFVTGIAGDLTPQLYGQPTSIDELIKNLELAWNECREF
jgi:ADP-dependent NAD(P)H-hydrate dehydratase / NAD(P)H-hydrate epimerase